MTALPHILRRGIGRSLVGGAAALPLLLPLPLPRILGAPWLASLKRSVAGRLLRRTDGRLSRGCHSGPPKHCFQQWEAIWSCLDRQWNLPTPIAKKCLAVGTSTALTQVSSTATTCTYRAWVDMMTTCMVDGDCASLADTAPPTLPPFALDCCQVCDCGGGGGLCCYSNFSTWSGVMPSLVAAVGSSAAEIALVDWWNGAIAGTSPVFVFSFCGCWVFSISSGGFNADLFLGCGGFGISINVYSDDRSNTLEIQTHNASGVPSSCCSFGPGYGWSSDVTDISISPSIQAAFTISGNFCCSDNTPSHVCFKGPGTCDGRCNFLP